MSSKIASVKNIHNLFNPYKTPKTAAEPVKSRHRLIFALA